MDWALHQSQRRFDIRAEREEYAHLFQHQARVLQDRLARRGHTDRTRHPAMPEWEKLPDTSARPQATPSSKGSGMGQREAILLCPQGTGLNHVGLSGGIKRVRSHCDRLFGIRERPVRFSVPPSSHPCERVQP